MTAFVLSFFFQILVQLPTIQMKQNSQTERIKKKVFKATGTAVQSLTCAKRQCTPTMMGPGIFRGVGRGGH